MNTYLNRIVNLALAMGLLSAVMPSAADAACPNGGSATYCPCTVTTNDITCDLDPGAATQGGTLYAKSPTATTIQIWGTDGENNAYCCEGGTFNDVAEAGTSCSNFIAVDGVDGYADLISMNNEAQTAYVARMVRYVHSLGGNDEIYGSPDTVCEDDLTGGDDNDTIFGLGGIDFIYGSGGNDTCYGGPGTDEVYGEAGDDTLSGDDGPDIVDGGVGDDKLKGGDGNDQMFGDADEDWVCGQAGDDNVYGGTENDIVIEGLGAYGLSTCGNGASDVSDFAEGTCETTSHDHNCPW